MTNIIIKKSNKKNIAFLYFNKKKIICLVGKNGIGNKCREGDMITPRGVFKMSKIYYRYDEIGKINTKIPSQKISKKLIWITDPKSKKYNSPSIQNSSHNFENFHRNDNIYDIVIVVNFNFSPCKKFKGSAIFIHCTEKNKNFTEGCIAVKKEVLIEMLKYISPKSFLIVN